MVFVEFGVFLIVLFAFTRLTRGVCTSSFCLIGKTALVTGANSGIGYQTVLNLASRGCRVIMADVEDMQEAKTNVIKLTNNSNIITKKLDLSSLQSVRDFTHDIIKTEPKLHILINNAGIASSKNKWTRDGLHPVMQVNYFGHFLLTHLLIDLLKRNSPSRIVFTSSFMSFYNYLSIDNLNYDVTFDNFLTRALIYCNSKHALLIASDIFAEKLKGTGVTSNSVNPGIVKTTLINQIFLPLISVIAILKFFVVLYINFVGKSPWEGAQVLVDAAVSKELEGTTGKHIWDCRPFVKPLGAYNPTFCKKIWEASEKFVRLEQHEKL